MASYGGYAKIENFGLGLQKVGLVELAGSSVNHGKHLATIGFQQKTQAPFEIVSKLRDFDFPLFKKYEN